MNNTLEKQEAFKAVYFEVQRIRTACAKRAAGHRPSSMSQPEPDAARAAVVAALDSVLDPELDEPVTDMGFVESVAAVIAAL